MEANLLRRWALGLEAAAHVRWRHALGTPLVESAYEFSRLAGAVADYLRSQADAIDVEAEAADERKQRENEGNHL